VTYSSIRDPIMKRALNCYTVKLGYNELGYNELGYNELGYNEHSVITINQPGYNEPRL